MQNKKTALPGVAQEGHEVSNREKDSSMEAPNGATAEPRFEQPPVTFTLWDSPPSCAKGYDLSPDGELLKVPAKIFSLADARRYAVKSLFDFSVFLGRLKPGRFITSGTSPLDSGEQRQVARRKVDYPFSTNPGLMVLDGDGLENFGISTAAQYVDALRSLDPALKNVGFVVAPSASSFVKWPNGEQGLRGLHAFCFIDNASTIPAILMAMQTKCVAVGKARGKVSTRGDVLIRSLVDTAMKTSNQPCFEGGARMLAEGLSQTRQIEVFDGEMLRADAFGVADATTVLAARKAEADIVRKLKPGADAQGVVWRAARVKSMLAQGVAEDKAEVLALKMQKGKRTDLPPEWPLYLDDGRCVTVAMVLGDLAAFDGLTCADPFEPEKGPCKAKIFCGANQQKPVVHSMVHGQDSCYFLSEKTVDRISLTHLTTSPDSSESYVEKGFEGDLDDKSNFTRTSPASPDMPFKRGSLIYEDEKGAMHHIVASQARNRVVPFLQPFHAWSSTAQTWHSWSSTHWTATETSASFDKSLHDLVAIGCSHLGFTPTYPRNITELIKTGASLPLPSSTQDGLVLPFENGLLDLRTKSLAPVNQRNALTWALPHRYEATADCPNIKYWLKQAVGDDIEMLEYLRAWLSAILTGRADLQKFLYLKGPGGSGKSTFIRLASMLVGASNAFTTDLRNLETNRFETASIYGKRLVVVTDAGRYGGAVDTLKALVGQDPMRIERKNVQQSGSFIFTGIVLFASNEQLISTDLTSGLDRRRAVVQFNRVVPEIEKAAWAKRGGEEAVLHKEIPGLVNWLLSIHKDEVTRIIASPPAQAADSNREAMLANNHVARWLAECCIPEKGVCTIVGQKKEVVENGQREIAFSSEHLYPNFIAFTIGEGVQPLGRGRFKETLIDASRTMGHPLENKRKPHSGVDSFFGIRLKSQSEPLYPWHRPIATAPSNDYAEVEI